ncbi:hypothetical protein [uncultured Bacteroides sp.]|uniref:hypothetical protein n=1 Tax=uncultured Bacteroides sp. TaxID=162156 RepID=UPI002AAAD0E4|nr:hypothetical protein [uncultured Bacteroides sp.]
MIKTKIEEVFPEHEIKVYAQDIYIADYTEQTKDEAIKRSVEVHTELLVDIESFCLHNPLSIEIDAVIFNNESFIDERGKTQTQCECVTFPSTATDSSWILFLELKYCERKNAVNNLPKAMNQLRATHSYYKSNGIITKKNTSYLIAAFPKLIKVPFRNSTLTPPLLSNLKRNENIVLSIANEATITSSEILSV